MQVRNFKVYIPVPTVCRFFPKPVENIMGIYVYIYVTISCGTLGEQSRIIWGKSTLGNLASSGVIWINKFL